MKNKPESVGGALGLQYYFDVLSTTNNRKSETAQKIILNLFDSSLKDPRALVDFLCAVGGCIDHLGSVLNREMPEIYRKEIRIGEQIRNSVKPANTTWPNFWRKNYGNFI